MSGASIVSFPFGPPSTTGSEEARPALLVVLVGLVGDDLRGQRQIGGLELGVDAVGDSDIDDLRVCLFFSRRAVDDQVDAPLTATERLHFGVPLWAVGPS